MASRRQIIIGGGAVLLGSAYLTVGALEGDATPAADFRIVHTPRLFLVPGRADHAYVSVESADGVDHVESITIDELGGHSKTRFEGLVEVINESESTFDGLYFTLDVESTSADPADIEGAISVVSPSSKIPATGDQNYLEHATVDGEDPDRLGPNDSVKFGVAINLQPGNADSSLTTLPDPETFDLSLELATTMA